MRKSFRNILLIVILAAFTACKVNYSFTGAAIAEDVKTVSVKTFQNFAPLANVNYSQTFSEALKDIFISQTNLNLATTEGDLQFEGSITNYQISSVAIQGNETAAKNRLTISVNVKFTNTKDKKQDFESDFTRFADYDSSVNISSIEDELIKEINNQLTQDIFNKSVGSW